MMEKRMTAQIKRNVQNLIFIIVIFIMLVSPSVYWLSLRGNWTLDSILEDRKLAVFPQVSLRDFKTAAKRIYQGLFNEAGEIFFNQFIDTSFQRRVNKAAAEQMLLRIPLVEFARAFERAAIRSAYLPLPDEALPASFDSGMYIARDGCCVLQELMYFTATEQTAVDARSANYTELLAKYPGIHFYVFNIETLQHSSFHPMAQYFPQADGGRSLQYFLDHKPADLRFENFTLGSFQDYKDSFFKTDQHWNIRASLEAYQEIYELIKAGYTDISPMLGVEEIEQVDGLEFLGSLARKTLYPVPPDTLEYAGIEGLEYDTYVDGVLMDYGGRDRYIDGTYNQSDKFENHYRGFYGTQKVQIQYHFENGSQRNLLMITSSYSRTIQLYIASHFRDTYIIDLRFEENRAKSLQDFIDQYQITDVLIFGQPSVTYYSAEDAIKP